MSLQKRLFTLEMYQAAIDVHRMMSAVESMVIVKLYSTHFQKL